MQTNITIGFTCGAWDLFHEGHLNFLTECKERCDYFIAGIVTDYWIRVQKGHDRPVHSLQLRLTNLREKCSFINKIIVIDTLDVSAYLQIADIWFKGGNQKNMLPINFPVIIYIPRTPNISTTQLLEEN